MNTCDNYHLFLSPAIIPSTQLLHTSMSGIESPFDNTNPLDSYGPGSPLAGAPLAAGGDDNDAVAWGLIITVVLIVLVLIVIWRFSNFRENRICISTDLADYWPDHLKGVPRLPGQDYLPALGDFLPAENMVTPKQPWLVNDNMLSAVASGN